MSGKLILTDDQIISLIVSADEHSSLCTDRFCALMRLDAMINDSLCRSPDYINRDIVEAGKAVGMTADTCIGVMDGWDKEAGRPVLFFGRNKDEMEYRRGLKIGKESYIKIMEKAYAATS